MLLGHEQLDGNITKVNHQLLQRQSQDEGSRACTQCEKILSFKPMGIPTGDNM